MSRQSRCGTCSSKQNVGCCGSADSTTARRAARAPRRGGWGAAARRGPREPGGWGDPTEKTQGFGVVFISNILEMSWFGSKTKQLSYLHCFFRFLGSSKVVSILPNQKGTAPTHETLFSGSPLREYIIVYHQLQLSTNHWVENPCDHQTGRWRNNYNRRWSGSASNQVSSANSTWKTTHDTWKRSATNEIPVDWKRYP